MIPLVTRRTLATLRATLVAGLAVGVSAPPSLSAAQQALTLAAEDRLLDGSPETLFRIGALDGEPWEQFESVRAAAFDAAGNLYVLDAGDPRVLKFSPAGEFLAQIGREGRGPGELTLPMGVVIHGDEIVVPDAAGGYVRFTLDGAYASTLRPAAPSYSRQMVLSDGAIVLPAGIDGSRRGGEGAPILRLPLRDGAAAIEIYEAPVPTVRTTVSGGDAGSRTFLMRRPPVFSPTVHLAGGGNDAIALVYGTDWAIQLIDPSGRRLTELRRPIRGRPVTERDRQAVIDRRAAASSQSLAFGGSALRYDAAKERPEFAEIIPVIRGLAGDGGGLLWIARETEPAGSAHPRVDVVTTDGRYLGTLRAQALPLAFGADGRAAFLEHDDLGVARVVVQRLPAAWLGR